jgi:formamidopyrimidine-DNA glycosylase
MPELPEVECVRRGLCAARLGAAVTGVWRSRFPLRIGARWSRASENLKCLLGAVPGPVRRRGKFLVWRFSPPRGGPPDRALVLHLGMTGVCEVAEHGQARAPHTHLIVRMEDGRDLRFRDARRFGGLHADTLLRLRAFPPLVALGPEPLSRRFDGDALARGLAGRRCALRDALLDQSVVAGIGNIYACEALFRARLYPLAPAGAVNGAAADRLAGALVAVLQQAIRNGGTTIRDYRGVGGESGRNQRELSVYGRAGQPCPRCGRPLVGFVHQGRSGVYCPRDQIRPRCE